MGDTAHLQIPQDDEATDAAPRMNFGDLVDSAMLPDLRRLAARRGRHMSEQDLGEQPRRSKVVSLAKKFVGTPHVWGGASPDGFDNSGLVQYLFNKVGITLPRMAYQQAQLGKRGDLKNLKPGDLVAWESSSRGPGANHVAIAIGNGLVIEAPRPGSSVQISEIYDQENAFSVRLTY